MTDTAPPFENIVAIADALKERLRLLAEQEPQRHTWEPCVTPGCKAWTRELSGVRGFCYNHDSKNLPMSDTTSLRTLLPQVHAQLLDALLREDATVTSPERREACKALVALKRAHTVLMRREENQNE